MAFLVLTGVPTLYISSILKTKKKMTLIMEIHFSCKTNHRLTNSNDMYPRWFQILGYIYAILIPKQLHGLDSFEAKPVTH